MPPKYIQNTFAGGIIRPELDPRTDLANYYNSVRAGKNVIFFTVGGAANRTGSFFCGKRKYPDKKSRVFSFRFSIAEQYLIEVGHEYIRFWKNDNLIVVENNPVEIITEYQEEDLDKLNIVQSADVLYILCNCYKTRELRRYSDTEWEFVEFDYQNGPFEPYNTDKNFKMEIFRNENLQYILATHKGYFATDLINSLFKIEKEFNSESFYVSLTASGTIGTFISDGNFKISSSGGWRGKLICEKSKDRVIWQEVNSWTSSSVTDPNNVNFVSEIYDDLNWYRLRLEFLEGTCNVNFSHSKFTYEIIAKIVDLVIESIDETNQQYKQAVINIINGVNDLVFSNNSTSQEYKSLLSQMASDNQNNIILTGQILKNGTTTNMIDVYKMFDKDINTGINFWVLPSNYYGNIGDYIPSKITIIYDAVSNAEFLSGKNANKIIIKNSGHYAKLGNLTVKFYYKNSLMQTLNFYIKDTLEVSFNLITFDKIQFEFTNFIASVPPDNDPIPSYVKCLEIEVWGYESASEVFSTDWWALGAWNERNGYPGAGAFSQDRLCLAASRLKTFTMWSSKTGIYNDFGKSNPAEASDAIDINLPSMKRDCPEILNLVGFTKLLVLSSSGETTVDLAAVEQVPQSQRGSDKPAPVVVGSTVLFVGPKGGSLRDLAYDFASDSYGSDDVTLKAKHLLAGKKIVRLAYAQDPNSIVYAVLDDGTMLTITYIKEQNAIAFSTFETPGQIEDIAVLSDGNYNDVYIAVKRNDDRYIEKIPARIIADDIMSDLLIDCATKFENVNKLTGLERFNGQNIVIACPDKISKTVTVNNGEAALDKTYSKVIAGIPFEAKIITLDAVSENKMAGQTIVDCKARISQIEAKWLYSAPDLIGTEENALEAVECVNKEADGKLFTGLSKQSVNSASSYDKAVIYKHTTPWPFMLLMLITKMELGDE
jgi:hypothetical protein